MQTARSTFSTVFFSPQVEIADRTCVSYVGFKTRRKTYWGQVPEWEYAGVIRIVVLLI